MDKKFNLTFVGAGPATMFGVLTLIRRGYTGDICIIEKGKSLKKRSTTEVISGSFGAGAFSDSKLSSALDVGGIIPGLTQFSLTKYETELINILNEFKAQTKYPEPLSWDGTEDYDTNGSGLSWNTHRTCHVGTEAGRLIYGKMEDFILSQPNIIVLFNNEVLDIDKEDDYILHLNNKSSVVSERVILATGQKNILPSQIIEKFKLRSKPRAFQVGVRVEDIINPTYEEIIKANYDFKFVKSYNFDNNINIRVRTFCCNSGNAHTVAEKAAEGFICFNGHAFKNPDPNNHTVNYGIMCEVEGLEAFESKEQQIEIMKKINAKEDWRSDNFYNDHKIGEVVLPKRKLLAGFAHLENYYPDEVIYALEDFTKCLNQVVSLEKAHYLYPEVKLSGKTPTLNYRTFETTLKGLYMIGDCSCTRGIAKSSYTGYRFAKSFLKGE